MRILLAEDDRHLNDTLTYQLEQQHFTVDSCLDGEEALYLGEQNIYDVILLDRMLPGMEGTDILTALRHKGIKTPVILITALGTLTDKVTGLDLGADDYLVKPFSFEELLARLRALLRTSFGVASNILSAADLTMDTAAHVVKRAEEEISLSAKEYELLEYLLHNKGIVLSREKIEDHIWNFDYEGGTNVVDVYISYLRKKIDGGRDKKLIHTVRGKGYVLREVENE